MKPTPFRFAVMKYGPSEPGEIWSFEDLFVARDYYEQVPKRGARVVLAHLTIQPSGREEWMVLEESGRVQTECSYAD